MTSLIIVDMEMLLNDPSKVFYYFNEINKIPRESGNEKEVSDFIVRFAKERNLKFTKDDLNNILITKPATPGYENSNGVILQAHLDMVCVKTENSNHNFLKDPIEMFVDGAYIRAKDTTLGADNGIGVALTLAILDSNSVKHPKIELLLTVDEEVGLKGSVGFNKQLLNGKYFINLDSEEEGEFTVGCAGGITAIMDLTINNKIIESENYLYKEIKISNLTGGHSGIDINKNRINAIKLAGRVLNELKNKMAFQLVEISGGVKQNVIPSDAFIKILIKDGAESIYTETLKIMITNIEAENKTVESELTIISTDLEKTKDLKYIDNQTLDNLIFLINGVPNGVQTMSTELEGFVESSLNLGELRMNENSFELVYAIRSSIKSMKYYIKDQLELFAKQVGARYITNSEYPAWPFKNKSSLVDKAVAVYQRMYNKEPIVKTIHAGLEVGVFTEELMDLEAISLGPDMSDVHSPKERVHIKSTQRVYGYLIELLEELK